MAEYPWYLNAVLYQVYIRAFYDSNGDGHGDFKGLIAKLDYIRDLGVDCIWIMPHYPSPLLDDGYDVADYYDVQPDYGTLNDFRALVKACHEKGLKLLVELIPNHVSDQNRWFQEARRSRTSKYRNYFVWSDSGEEYAEARIIFTDTEHSNWAYDELAGQYYWHRFFSHQPDLNYDHPQVLEELLKVMRFWLDMGIDGFRVDAVPYLVEREGTSCENLPETHTVLKRMRRLIDEEYPGRVLLCESNQWPRDVIPYFGNGRDEFHLAYHFPLMPRIFLALASGDPAPIHQVMRDTPPNPPGTAWVTFLRNHDELTLEMVTEEERALMYGHYAPDPIMKKNVGIRRRLAPLLDNDRKKVELAFTLLLSLPGCPIIYYGDELGMGDNLKLDDRNALRTPMQWDDTPGGGFSDSPRTYAPAISDDLYGFSKVNVAASIRDRGSLYHYLRRLIRDRKDCAALMAGAWEPWALDNPQLLAIKRTGPGEQVVALFNFTAREQVTRTLAVDRYEIYRGRADIAGAGVSLAPLDWVWLRGSTA